MRKFDRLCGEQSHTHGYGGKWCLYLTASGRRYGQHDNCTFSPADADRQDSFVPDGSTAMPPFSEKSIMVRQRSICYYCCAMAHIFRLWDLHIKWALDAS